MHGTRQHPTPTPLEKALAATLHAAAWEGKGPSCPDCFDGADLVPGEPPLAHPGLGTYRCRACLRNFSDLWPTPLSAAKQPLARWALALLMDAPPRLWPAQRQKTHKALRQKLLSSPFSARWQAALAAQQISSQQLLQSLNARNRRRPR